MHKKLKKRVKLNLENRTNTADKVYHDLQQDKSYLKVKKNLYFSYELRIFFLIILCILFGLMGVLFFQGGIQIKTAKEVTYQEKGNVDYQVYLKENDYYEEKFLGKDRQYIASLIDNIKIQFDYQLTFDKNMNYDYSYYIGARVKVVDKENQDKVIYEKNDVLKEKNTYKKIDKNLINIHDTVEIDYDQYNDLIRGFKTAYGLSSDSYLELYMYVETTGNYVDFKNDINKNGIITIKIPLTEQTINIQTDYQEVDKSDKFVEYSNTEIMNYLYLIISVLFVFFCIFFFIKIINLLFKGRCKKSQYQKRLAKILREYDRVIVEAKRDYNRGECSIIDVTTFEELLDVKDNIEGPIIHIVINSTKSEFLVKHQNVLYRYVLKEVDVEERKK